MVVRIYLKEHVSCCNLSVPNGYGRYRKPTCAKNLENGMPPSRAKANVNRETEVSSARLEAMAMMIIADSIADAPALEFVACLEIAMIGKPVFVLRAPSIFPIEKSSASNIPKAIKPLMTIERNITRGIVTAESLTSSDLCWASQFAIRARRGGARIQVNCTIKSW